jgi:hypothetical protein
VLLKRGPALVLVTAVLVGLIAAPAASGSGRFFGLDYTFTELHNRDARTLAKSGAKTVRWTFAWPRIEPSSGNFKWSDADRFVGAMAARGISVLPVLDRSPRWVSRSAVTPRSPRRRRGMPGSGSCIKPWSATAPERAIGPSSTGRSTPGGGRFRSESGRSGTSQI